ncbi:MAG TPA: phage tail protein [Allosphingosinicella sp.]|nr:phage tail protein [Allosphingosinicella sp.]
MATLILTAVGSAIGGPIGGAIGAIAGQYVDQNILFAPKPRHGPRLGDLAVQTSSYGAMIPRIFGTMRVAGTMIWATDLAEHRAASGGGKGRPRTINYSYSASFAVALSARPILGVGRIWADGKLLRGAAGDFKSATGFRLYIGDEDQPADPLIAAAEGIGTAPAFRGLAYAMFEDFQLEDYGNRIPSLTFEVEADPGAVAIGAIAEVLAPGAVAAGPTPALAGYAASGDSVRSAIEALADVVPLSLADDGQLLRLAAAGDDAAALAAADEHGRRELTRRGAGSLPDEVSLTYYEVGRDYQAGLQRATRGAGGGIADRRALPAALTAEGAKALAEFRLAAAWAGRVGLRLSLSWRGCAIRPGDRVTLAGEAGLWKVARFTLGPMRVDLELVRLSKDGLPDPVAASAGEPVSQADLPHGPTLVHLLDLPLGDGPGNKPLLFVAAAGSEAGWRRAVLSASYDGGGSWQAAGATAAPAAIGVADSALPPAGSALFDTVSALEVELANAAMWLEARSDEALAAGANLALVGGELIQFGAAEPLGANRFRLSRLLRGRRGTEWAAAGHEAGERFVLLDAESLAVLEAPAGSLGGTASLLAAGIGDLPDAAAASAAIEGAALQPPSPVHLNAEETPDGDLLIAWVRRSRQGWAWPGGSDTPLGEERELYRLEIAGAGFARTAAPAEPHYLYSAAERLEDGGAGPIQIEVAQIGTFAPSRPARLILS